MSSIDDELDNLFNEKVDIKKEFQYYNITVCKLKESLVYKPLLDSNGVPFKVLHNVRQGSVELINDNNEKELFRFRLCDKSDFNKLSKSHNILIDELNKEMDIYCNKECNKDSWMFRPTRNTVLSFGIVISMGPVNYNSFRSSLLIVNSSTYLRYLSDFIDSHKMIYGVDGLEKLYLRSLSINSGIRLDSKYLVDKGYAFNMNYETFDEIEVSEEVIDRMDNLDSEYIDVNNFNEEVYEIALRELRKVNEQSV